MNTTEHNTHLVFLEETSVLITGYKPSKTSSNRHIHKGKVFMSLSFKHFMVFFFYLALPLFGILSDL